MIHKTQFRSCIFCRSVRHGVGIGVAHGCRLDPIHRHRIPCKYNFFHDEALQALYGLQEELEARERAQLTRYVCPVSVMSVKTIAIENNAHVLAFPHQVVVTMVTMMY